MFILWKIFNWNLFIVSYSLNITASIFLQNMLDIPFYLLDIPI